ncbi:hypothetical protein EJ04DRAFT_447514 [Polyplosphaeria fusca]|uniref:Uncharacterized protein n=1 Tax=Polyplosphaeria fusca TaxID=682080 RepID=A0A9P4QQZ0_9PLEO|nr:hypothetical protein EJ04DRAFT_447514 [Polyplosphaeria fusca]
MLHTSVDLYTLTLLSVNPRQAASGQSTPNLGYDKLLELQKMFWNRFEYPNNIKEAEAINSTIFSDDVQGRVSDTRNFEGRELNTEYIFGLFTPTDATGIIGRPGDWEILQFVANQNIASASTRVQFTFPAFNNVSYPVVIDTWLTWNEQDQITQYDVTFRWFGYLLQTLVASVDKTNATHAAGLVVHQVATSICNSHARFCNGTNVQYSSSDECYDFLTTKIRVGQGFELGMDTLMCRSVHEIMLKYRPDVHCSHIGKSGGGMCVDDVDYVTKASEQYFVNAPWIPNSVVVKNC